MVYAVVCYHSSSGHTTSVLLATALNTYTLTYIRKQWSDIGRFPIKVADCLNNFNFGWTKRPVKIYMICN